MFLDSSPLKQNIRDVYNRKLCDGDYVLVDLHWRGNYIGWYTVAKIQNGKLLVSDLIDKVEFINSYPWNAECYKVENPDDLCIDLLNYNNFISLLYTENYYESKSNIDENIKDIFNREIKLGDFVMYKDGLTFLYGIVIDEKHIFTHKLVKKKIDIVYKVITPIQKELEMYNYLSLEYAKLQKTLIQGSRNKKYRDIKPGDAFRKNNNLHIYLGEFYFHAYESILCNIDDFLPEMSKDILDDKSFLVDDVVNYQNKKMKVFLCLNMGYKKSKQFIEKLKMNSVTQKEFELMVITSGLKYGIDLDKFEYPRLLKFDLSERRAGTYVETFDVSQFNLMFKYRQNMYYKSNVHYLYYVFNDFKIDLV